MFSSTALDYKWITLVFCSTAQPNVNNQRADSHANTMHACMSWRRLGENVDNYTHSLAPHSNGSERWQKDLQIRTRIQTNKAHLSTLDSHIITSGVISASCCRALCSCMVSIFNIYVISHRFSTCLLLSTALLRHQRLPCYGRNKGLSYPIDSCNRLMTDYQNNRQLKLWQLLI